MGAMLAHPEEDFHDIRHVHNTRDVEELGDLKEEAIHRVKHQPLKAVGLALGVGLVLGLAIGWIGRPSGRQEHQHQR